RNRTASHSRRDPEFSGVVGLYTCAYRCGATAERPVVVDGFAGLCAHAWRDRVDGGPRGGAAAPAVVDKRIVQGHVAARRIRRSVGKAACCIVMVSIVHTNLY